MFDWNWLGSTGLRWTGLGSAEKDSVRLGLAGFGPAGFVSAQLERAGLVSAWAELG